MPEQDSEHPLVGQVLADRYRIEALLGEGGMGAVFRARHLSLDRAVAVKVLKPSLVDDEKVAKRFDREALAVSKLDHPNCVQVIDFGTTPKGMKYLVMQYLDGRELRDLTGFSLPVEQAVGFGIQILRALEHAHKRGLVHRDLKPENIFLVRNDDGEQVVKLVDFGIVKLLEGAGQEKLTQMGMAFGTPTYMSPEQAAGGIVDERSDLYAVGVLLYEMLTGAPPFDADEPGILLRMHILSEPPPLPDTIPAAVAAVVGRLLAKEPDERYGSAREARVALVASLEPTAAAGAEAAASPRSDADTGPGPTAPAVAVAPTISAALADTRADAPAASADELAVPVRSGGTVVAGSSMSHGSAPIGGSLAHGASSSYGGAPMAGASMSYGSGSASSGAVGYDPLLVSNANLPRSAPPMASAYGPGAKPARRSRSSMTIVVIVLLVLTWVAIGLVWWSSQDDDRVPPVGAAAPGTYRFADDGAATGEGGSDSGSGSGPSDASAAELEPSKAAKKRKKQADKERKRQERAK